MELSFLTKNIVDFVIYEDGNVECLIFKELCQNFEL
jgi:hypothetical protein